MSFICGLGGSLPQRCVSNEEFALLAGMDADWIRQRAGIRQRFLARPGVDTVELAAMASREALGQAPELAGEVGLVVLATSFPGALAHASPAAILARRLGLTRAHAVDLSTPFLGFLDALRLALVALERSEVGAALVVGAEGMSAVTQLRDRRTSYLLSDGAGALLLSRERGFVRLGVPTHGRQPGEELASDGETLSLSPLGAPVAGRCLGAAVERGAGPQTVITQLIGEGMVPELPEGVSLYNPYADAGHLLAAALPLSLYRFLGERRPPRGTRGLLFASSGTGAFGTCPLEIVETPPPLSAGQETTLLLEAIRLPREGLRNCLLKLSASAEPFVGLSFVGLRMVPQEGSPVPPTALEGVTRETEWVLRRHLRNTDRLFRLEGGLVYGLFLRRIEIEDAWNLARRLARVLHELDLAGEIQWEVDSTAVHLASREEQAGFADRLGDWLLR